MIEGSVTGARSVPRSNGSGAGRFKNLRIGIRIPNTAGITVFYIVVKNCNLYINILTSTRRPSWSVGWTDGCWTCWRWTTSATCACPASSTTVPSGGAFRLESRRKRFYFLIRKNLQKMRTIHFLYKIMRKVKRLARNCEHFCNNLGRKIRDDAFTKFRRYFNVFLLYCMLKVVQNLWFKEWLQCSFFFRKIFRQFSRFRENSSIDFRANFCAGVAHARLWRRLFEAASRGRGRGGGGEQLCRLEQSSGHGVAQTGGYHSSSFIQTLLGRVQ